MIANQAKTALTLGGLLALGGCCSTAPEYQYQCDDGHQFAASFFGQEKALITVDDGREIELKRVRSASGAKYMSYDQMLVLHTKGDGAILVVNEISQSSCRVMK
ncbi:MliC family protein [Vibrio sp. 1CM8B]|uniref:MliC family protein n=1 Tax=Vibrio sp. 1CM8B TaxID=2929167 RepID=UPI0020BD4C95|nr:MliC family protein [Vibrio sp. 1CM8B]MCK8086004.1 MliC family protein [Vibrio sp. 1CM8B]